MSIDGVGVGNFELNALFFPLLLPRESVPVDISGLLLAKDGVSECGRVGESLALAKS